MMTETVTRPSMAADPSLLRGAVRLSWGALIGGIAVALGVWMLLTALGLAIGLSSIDPGDPGSVKVAGMTTGIWSLIVPFVALFVGGLVAARTAGIVDRTTGAIHGAVLWAVATILGTVMIGMLLSGLLGIAGATVSTVGARTGDIGKEVAPALGIDSDDLVAPLNERLRAEGSPTVTAAQIESAVRDATRASIREGRIDRDIFVRSIVENTRLSESDARMLADRVQARAAEGARGVQETAMKAADTTGKAMWWLFFGMLVSLVSAVLGATVGVSRRQRRAAAAAEDVTPIVPPREAHSS